MKLILSFLLSSLFFFPVSADVGSAVVYKAKFVLKDKTSFIGYVPISGYEVYLDENGRNEHCSDKALQLMLIQHFTQYGTNKLVKIYDNIHLVSRGPKENRFSIGCVDKSKIKTINVFDIKYTVFMDAEYAQYDWYVYGIQEVDSNTMSTIRKHPPVNYEEMLMSTKESEGLGIYASFINFNPDISSAELYRIIADLSRKLHIDENGVKTIPSSLKASLQAKHIFVFYGYVGPC
ncbi:MAG: hypothetical protein JNM22_01655 [Saprospiraceae bacterium]|nr:hypothetical protein [Saprospiraceae bacterium]